MSSLSLAAPKPASSECRENNILSVKTALSCGFEKVWDYPVFVALLIKNDHASIQKSGLKSNKVRFTVWRFTV
jgi:hypothetical protein